MSYDTNFGETSIDVNGMEGLMGMLGSFIIIFILISLAISAFYIIVYWKLFKKANQPGWAAIVPVYNTIVMLNVARMPLWWIAVPFLVFIPKIGWIGLVVFNIFFSLNIAKVFGKDTTFGVLTIFFSPITIPILAFGDAKYIDNETPISSVPEQNQSTPVQPQPTEFVPNTGQPNENQIFENPISSLPEQNQSTPVQPQPTEFVTSTDQPNENQIPETQNVPIPEQTQNNDTTNQ